MNKILIGFDPEDDKERITRADFREFFQGTWRDMKRLVQEKSTAVFTPTNSREEKLSPFESSEVLFETINKPVEWTKALRNFLATHPVPQGIIQSISRVF